MDSFYSKSELLNIGFKKIGDNVLISKKSSIYNAERISIGSNVRIDDFTILSGDISLGNYIHIAAFSALFAGNYGIEMNDFSGLSSRVTIYASSDDYSGKSLTNPTVPSKYRNTYGGKVTLKKHVIIGASSVILPNLTIGEGASIGSCSLVIHDCNPFSIYVGTPAKEIKKRSQDLLKLEDNLLNL